MIFSLRSTALAALLVTSIGALPTLSSAADSNSFQWRVRKRAETKVGSGRFSVTQESQDWKASKTAFIVCDMWDLHHCLNATKRGAEMAPRMNEVLKTARNRGATIIHAPSSCMKFYTDHPARKRALNIPRADRLPKDIGSWCHQISSEEKGEYPIDQSDGGEDDDPEEHKKWAEELKSRGRNPKAPWIRQAAALTIDSERDFISDNGEEIWSILTARSVDNVVLVGVHTNMCVLGRPFGLRQMASNGKNVVLMRDMTDTMYNPARKPFVSHFTGTDLIIEHIEKWVCPTVTSDQLLGGKEFRFQQDSRARLVMLIGEREYQTNESLPAFARKHLGHDYSVTVIHANEEDRNDFPGAAEAIRGADLLLVSVRRRALPEQQMKAVRAHIESGKPVVGVRTANHAFSLRGKEPPKGCLVWEKFDQEVIGGNYSGHHGAGPDVQVQIAKNADEQLLEGVDLKKLVGCGSLYTVSPLQPSSRALLIGTIPGKSPEPIAWTHESKFGGRVFYTSLGHVADFEQESFQRLLKNALNWATAD